MNNVTPIYRSKEHEQQVRDRISANEAEIAVRRRYRDLENEVKEAIRQYGKVSNYCRNSGEEND